MTPALALSAAPPTERAPSDSGAGAGSIATPAASGSLLAYFLITFAVTWTCFISVVVSGVSIGTLLGQILLLFGTFAPAMVALALTARSAGSAGVRGLLARITTSGVTARWYVFALVYLLAIKLTAAVLHRVATGAWPRFGHEAWYLIPVAIAISTPVQAGEEIGWRGYALPRLAARLGLGGAGVLLGAIWALWHLPLFFVREADTYGQSFIMYALSVIAMSVAMTWLYAHVRGSLLPVMLMHAAVNNTKDIVPSATPGAMNTFGLSASLVAWLTVALLWACALFFLVRMPRDLRAAGVAPPGAC